jgi:hypothetical protein
MARMAQPDGENQLSGLKSHYRKMAHRSQGQQISACYPMAARNYQL